MLETVIGLAAGAVGGNVGGRFFPNLSLGTLGNSVAGIAGGAILPMVLNMIGLGGAAGAVTGDGGSIMGIVSGLGGGLVGGTGVMAIAGAVKNMMGK